MAQDQLPVEKAEPAPAENPLSQKPAQAVKSPARRRAEGLVLAGVWLVTFSVMLLAVYIGWKQQAAAAATPPAASQAATLQVATQPAAAAPTAAPLPAGAALPGFSPQSLGGALVRTSTMHTNVPARGRETPIEYTVVSGDSVFSIAKDFNLKPESVLWANYDSLQDSPDSLVQGHESIEMNRSN